MLKFMQFSLDPKVSGEDTVKVPDLYLEITIKSCKMQVYLKDIDQSNDNINSN